MGLMRQADPHCLLPTAHTALNTASFVPPTASAHTPQLAEEALGACGGSSVRSPAA